MSLEQHKDGYPAHPLSALLPLMGAADLVALTDDIRRCGQREKIILFDGMVLDGRNRQTACRLAGVSADYGTYEGDDPLGFVLSMNLHRRHLTESQRAMVGARMATWKRGVNQFVDHGKSVPAWQAAKALSVSARSVAMGRNVEEKGIPELAEAVRHGALKISVADGIARLGHGAQREALRRKLSVPKAPMPPAENPYSMRLGNRPIGLLTVYDLKRRERALRRELAIVNAIIEHAGAAEGDSRVEDIVSRDWLASALSNTHDADAGDVSEGGAP